MLQEMQKRGQLTIRINALLRPAIGPSGVDPALAASGIRQNEGDEQLRIGGIKLAVDGGFEGGLMRDLYEKPWDENGTYRGLQTIDTERYIAAVRELNRQDWRVATHAVGDAAIDLVLNAYEKANAERSIVGAALVDRARLHRQARSPAADEGAWRSDRRAESPVSGGAQPREILGRRARCHHHAGEDVSRRAAAGVFGHATRRSCLIRRFGRCITSSPATRSPAACSGPIRRVSRQDALRMATINNAWLNMEERTKGSIEPGKFADLVILSEDPLTCPETRCAMRRY